jgi:hypothetical protein
VDKTLVLDPRNYIPALDSPPLPGLKKYLFGGLNTFDKAVKLSAADYHFIDKTRPAPMKFLPFHWGG